MGSLLLSRTSLARQSTMFREGVSHHVRSLIKVHLDEKLLTSVPPTQLNHTHTNQLRSPTTNIVVFDINNPNQMAVSKDPSLTSPASAVFTEPPPTRSFAPLLAIPYMHKAMKHGTRDRMCHRLGQYMEWTRNKGNESMREARTRKMKEDRKQALDGKE